MLQHTRSVLAASAAAVVVAFAMPPSTAFADGVTETSVRDMTIRYDVRKDGSVHVTERYTVGFAEDKHGIERSVVTTQGYDPDPSKSRRYAISHVTVTSPSGAPATVEQTEPGDGTTNLRIGDAGIAVNGIQRYVVSYDLGKVLNAQPKAKAAELYWNVTGDQWQMPIEKVTVTVAGPAPATRAACTWGPQGSTEKCTAKAGATSTYSVGRLEPGEQMTIAEQMPLKAFGNLAPDLVANETVDDLPADDSLGTESTDFPGVIEPVVPVDDGLAGGLAAGGALALAGAGYGLSRTYRRGAHYAGVAPDTIPSAGEPATIVSGGPATVTAVRFNAPDAPAGLLGTVMDGRAGAIDVSATVIDLAVRGYLRIEEVPGGFMRRRDWRLIALRDLDGSLAEYERTLLRGIFAGGSPVYLSQLRTHFSGTLARVQSQLDAETVRRGWYPRSPRATRTMWGAAALLPFAGAVAVLMMPSVQGSRFGLAAAALFAVAGVVALVASNRSATRTASGAAIAEQGRGFREYLLTAEAGQIAYDEAANVFTRYLPYAVVFGCADRWAKVFASVAAAAERDGFVIDQPAFFLLADGMHGWHDFGRDLQDFTHETASSFSAAAPSTSGSSGGSAFSSGGGSSGGSSGGGGGGGGGGSW